jgi:hypothetical protein
MPAVPRVGYEPPTSERENPQQVKERPVVIVPLSIVLVLAHCYRLCNSRRDRLLELAIAGGAVAL